GVHEAAAVITFLAPGLRFFHQGEFLGRKKRISPHLCRGPDEPTDQELAKFYDRLLAVLRRPPVRDGQWQLLECVPAWQGNWTCDCIGAFAWQGRRQPPLPPGERGRGEGERLFVAVNYASNQSQCYVWLPFPELRDRHWLLQDQLSPAAYERDGSE